MLFSRFSQKSPILACVYVLLGGGAVIVHKARLLSRVGGEGGARAPTFDPHTIKCMQVPLSPIHLSPFC
jgi:hypothetical protein